MTPEQVLSEFKKAGALLEGHFIGVKLVALAPMKVPAWEADKLPPHLRDIPAVKPGSRGLA